MSELPQTIADAAQWLRDGRITSVALTEALLDRSHAAQDTLAAFITINDASAFEAARRADRELAQGIDRGPLQGIPIAIKDLIATADAPTTANSRVLDPEWGRRADATVVRKLRTAGAVIIGKLGLHEFAIGWPDPSTGFRIPKNPWDLSRSPGDPVPGRESRSRLAWFSEGSERTPAARFGDHPPIVALLGSSRPSGGSAKKDACR